jgi:hypothetical protein
MDRVDTSDTTLGMYEFIFKHSKKLEMSKKHIKTLWDRGALQTRCKMKREQATNFSITQKGFHSRLSRTIQKAYIF